MKRRRLPAGDAGYSACGEDTQDAALSSPPGRGCPSAALSYLASPHRMDSGRAGRGAGGTRITRETRWAVGEVGTTENMEKEDHEEKTPGQLGGDEIICADVADSQAWGGGQQSHPDRGEERAELGCPPLGHPSAPQPPRPDPLKTFLTGTGQETQVRTLQSFPAPEAEAPGGVWKPTGAPGLCVRESSAARGSRTADRATFPQEATPPGAGYPKPIPCPFTTTLPPALFPKPWLVVKD